MARIVEYRRRLRGPRLAVPPSENPVEHIAKPEESVKAEEADEPYEDEG
jgi:hypothetical protein